MNLALLIATLFGSPAFQFSPSNFQVICPGNSLVFGEGASAGAHAWPQVMSTLPPLSTNSVTAINVGVSGSAISSVNSGNNMLARIFDDIGARLVADKTTFIVPLEFTNELGLNGGDDTAAFAQWLTYFSEIVSGAADLGCPVKTITVTVPPAYIPSVYPDLTSLAYNQAVGRVNARMRTDWPTFADGIFDLARLPMFASLIAAGTFTQAEFAATGLWARSDGVTEDDVHFGNAAYAVIAQGAADALKRMPR